MSRIGKMPVAIPNGVKIDIKGSSINVEGPLGKLHQSINSRISAELKDGKVLVTRKSEAAIDKSLHGLSQRLISNMVKGVTSGYEKNLEIVGVGHRAKVDGKNLILQLGFSHPVKYSIPETIKIAVADNVKINVKGPDKQLVGHVADEIRRYYPPEPYKGKGIRYAGEYVRRKAGKAVAAKGGAGGTGGK